jgi:hypothetical protein
MINLNQILSLARAILNLAGGSIVAKGVTDSSTWEAVAGGVLAAVSIAWSYWHHAEPAPTAPAKP